MHKWLVGLSLAVLAATSFAWPWDDKIDDYTRDEVAFARKGSLGGDSYVVTNVVPMAPAYMLASADSTNLVDRAINRFTPKGDTAFIMPPPPAKRECDAYRNARSFLLFVTVTNDTPPAVSFIGAKRLVSDDWSESVRLSKGENLLAFMELADGVFLVEAGELTEIKE